MSLEKLNKLIQNRGLLKTKIKTHAYVCHIAKTVLDNYFKSENLKIISYKKNQVLKVSVPSLVVANQIAFKQKTIILKINERLDKQKVKEIKTVLSHRNT